MKKMCIIYSTYVELFMFSLFMKEQSMVINDNLNMYINDHLRMYTSDYALI